MTEHGPRAARWDWMSPSAERLRSKFTNLQELQEEFKARKQTAEQEPVLAICDVFLRKAEGYLDRPAISSKCPFFSRKHPHLVWEYLHRVDEYHILLLRDEEIYNKTIEVRTAFDLNIKEEKTRSDWIGSKGRLQEVLETLRKHSPTPSNRDAVKRALQLVNEQVDRTFWQLSANTLTSVWSALVLGILMWWAWKHLSGEQLAKLGQSGLWADLELLIILGLMGAYLSNLLTKEDFLYVRGGPFFRYFLHNLTSKPLIGVFAAVFMYVVVKSELIFSINPIAPDKPIVADGGNAPVSQLITFNVSEASEGYVYAVLAVVSAFAADKLLRSTIDSVLKRMEQKAEKTKDSGKE